MSLTLKTSVAFCILTLAAFAQAPSTAPKYDNQTETKTKGVIEEIKTFTIGKRADYTELILKNGEDKLEIYLSPKPYQDEMGMAFAKGDEIGITGSKIKLEDTTNTRPRQTRKAPD